MIGTVGMSKEKGNTYTHQQNLYGEEEYYDFGNNEMAWLIFQDLIKLDNAEFFERIEKRSQMSTIDDILFKASHYLSKEQLKQCMNECKKLCEKEKDGKVELSVFQDIINNKLYE